MVMHSRVRINKNQSHEERKLILLTKRKIHTNFIRLLEAEWFQVYEKEKISGKEYDKGREWKEKRKWKRVSAFRRFAQRLNFNSEIKLLSFVIVCLLSRSFVCLFAHSFIHLYHSVHSHFFWNAKHISARFFHYGIFIFFSNFKHRTSYHSLYFSCTLRLSINPSFWLISTTSPFVSTSKRVNSK